MASARLTDRKRVFIHIVCIKLVQLSYCYWCCCCCCFRRRRRWFQASGSAFSFGLLFVRERAQKQNCSFLTQRITGFLLAICWHYYYYFGAAWCRLLFFFDSIYIFFLETTHSRFLSVLFTHSNCFETNFPCVFGGKRWFWYSEVFAGATQQQLMLLLSTQISLLLYY